MAPPYRSEVWNLSGKEVTWMEQEKKAYVPPKLVEYGDVEDLTLNAGRVNRDNPNGPDNSAFPNHGP